MKSILLSIRPEWVVKILNGEKTIEVRKNFPKDFVGWVYIYCTKDKKNCLVRNNVKKTIYLDTCYFEGYESNLNGKVVARFWCDKVEQIEMVDNYDYEYETYTLCEPELINKSCLTLEELNNYLDFNNGYAIHISKLEIFDRPKELCEFGYYESDETMPHRQIVKASQNYCFVESEN